MAAGEFFVKADLYFMRLRLLFLFFNFTIVSD